MTQPTTTQKRNIPEGVLSLAQLDANGVHQEFYSHASSRTGSQLTFSVDTVKHKESESGLNLEIISITTGINGEVTLQLETNEIEGLELSLQGVKVVQASGTATDEPIIGSTTLVAGGLYPLTHTNITALTTVKDSAGTPATLALGTDYSIDPLTDMIKILSVGTFVGPLKATYTYGTANSVIMMTDTNREHFVRINTINKAKGNAKEIHELYRVKFAPADNKALKSDNVVTLTLKGTVLADPNRANDAVYGQFGRVIQL